MHQVRHVAKPTEAEPTEVTLVELIETKIREADDSPRWSKHAVAAMHEIRRLVLDWEGQHRQPELFPGPRPTEAERRERFVAWIDSCIDADGTHHEWTHTKKLIEWLPDDPNPDQIAELRQEVFRMRDIYNEMLEHSCQHERAADQMRKECGEASAEIKRLKGIIERIQERKSQLLKDHRNMFDQLEHAKLERDELKAKYAGIVSMIEEEAAALRSPLHRFWNRMTEIVREACE